MSLKVLMVSHPQHNKFLLFYLGGLRARHFLNGVIDYKPVGPKDHALVTFYSEGARQKQISRGGNTTARGSPVKSPQV